MAYFSLHAYDADVWIPQFLGLNQADDGMNQDIRYAAEAVNMETINGTLQPQAPITVLPTEADGTDPFGANRIETLAWFYRRWYDKSNKSWLVAAVGGQLYYKPANMDAKWKWLEPPSGTTSFMSNEWSWVAYEINISSGEEEEEEEEESETGLPIDILVISNPKDGMFMIVPPVENVGHPWEAVKEYTWLRVKEDTNEDPVTWQYWIDADWYMEHIDTGGKKFGMLERSNERIWGAAIDGEPDTLIYSKPYVVTDWTIDTEHPEDGAGQIDIPTWDGDSFTALKQFGDQLLVFKQHRTWRILGVSPGTYDIKEQYGGGTAYGKTVAVYVDRVLMADRDGPAIYNGDTVSPYAREQIRQIWNTVNRSAMDQMCACVYDRRYYLSIPVNGSLVNNAMLMYDMDHGTILYYKDIYIESMLPTDDGLFATSSSLPGKVLKIGYDSWKTGETSGRATKWVTPWMDFGYKRIVKGGFDLYFSPEVQDEDVTLKISIQTEKKTKTKEYIVRSMTPKEDTGGIDITETPVETPGEEPNEEPEEEPSEEPEEEAPVLLMAGQAEAVKKEYRYKRLHFGGTGRKFRIVIESKEGITAPWRIVGGLHLVVETDPD